MQALVRWRVSVAVQLTCVNPTGNNVPVAGVQLVAIGAAPPVTVGAP